MSVAKRMAIGLYLLLCASGVALSLFYTEELTERFGSFFVPLVAVLIGGLALPLIRHAYTRLR